MFIDKRRADKLSTRTINRQATVTIGRVTGRLDAVLPIGDQVNIVLIVGGSKAWFTLDADTIIDVHRAEPKP